MKYIITENRIVNIIKNYLIMTFPSFEDVYDDWANFNCGMGVCCDQYAIGFVLPESEYDDYLFKLVNSKLYDDDGDYPEDLRDDLPEPCYNSPDIHDQEFDTIIISEDMYERLNDLFNDINVWGDSLLYVINKVFNTKARTVLYPYLPLDL
jgi:hypothetical protein